MQEPSMWLSLVQDFGLPLTFLVATLYAFITEKIVPGERHKKLEARYEDVLKEQREDADTAKDTVKALTALLSRKGGEDV